MAQISTTVPASSLLVTTVATNLATFNAGGANEITQGLKTFAARFNALVAIYNLWITHDHDGFNDYVVDPGTIYSADTDAPHSTADVPFPPLALSMSVGGKMNAANVNTLVNAINAIRTHRHNVYDDY